MVYYWHMSNQAYIFDWNGIRSAKVAMLVLAAFAKYANVIDKCDPHIQ